MAASKSKERKAKDKNRGNKGSCLGPLHISDSFSEKLYGAWGHRDVEVILGK